MRTRISIIIAAALGVLAVVAPIAGAATDRHIARLDGSAGYPAANGKVKSAIDDGVRQIEGELEDAKALRGTQVQLVIRTKVVDTATVDAFGDADFDASGAGVPPVAAGAPAKVKTASGKLVASGRFG